MPARRLGALAQEVEGQAVGEVDAAVLVEADDPCRYAAQHRLDEAVAVVELLVGLEQGVLLALQLAGHLVDGARQVADLVTPRRAEHASPEFALAYPLGGGHPAAERPRPPTPEATRVGKGGGK